MVHRLQFLINRLRERLWFKPLLMCLISLFGALLAKAVEATPFAQHIPPVDPESVGTLLMILSGSMLVIATFAVGAMVSSFASASSNATPRTFPLVVSDDVSQNALSMFVGAFIYSLVAITFLRNDAYHAAGITTLLLFTIITFAVVILTFVRWVDRLARLGRLGETIDKVEAATGRALQRRRLAPTLACSGIHAREHPGTPVPADAVGYVQRIDLEGLQRLAEQARVRITVRAVPGAFTAPDTILAHVIQDPGAEAVDPRRIARAFRIGDARTFDDDPRFGLIVLSEIAGRALSPAVNDPGTAIDITGTLVRLFTGWAAPVDPNQMRPRVFDRVELPELSVEDLFDDAFTAIARDGAGTAEVAIRLQKALRSISTLPDPRVRTAAVRHSRLALARAESALTLSHDLDSVRGPAAFSEAP